MDPMPPMNKVFALISQEEQQRKIGIPASDSTNTMAFAAKIIAPKGPAPNSCFFNNPGGFKGQNNTG
ncbi:hypothetical protein TorRG33x02_345880, partial [Trema orientale]